MIHGAATNTVIIMGAAVRSDGSAGLTLVRRVNHAVRLFRSNSVDTIICSGGIVKNQQPEAIAMLVLLESQSIPRDNIFLELRSKSTIENAIFSLKLAEDLSTKNIYVSSDIYHYLRCKLIFWILGKRIIFTYPSFTFSEFIDRSYLYYWIREISATPSSLIRITIHRFLTIYLKNC